MKLLKVASSVVLALLSVSILSGCSFQKLTEAEQQDLSTCKVLAEKDSSHLASFAERKTEFRAEKWEKLQNEKGYLSQKLFEYKALIAEDSALLNNPKPLNGSFLDEPRPAKEAQRIWTHIWQACKKLGISRN
jgi:hypothetical protein